LKGIDTQEALELIECEGPELYDLFSRAGSARYRNNGSRVSSCAVINAKSGHCPEDCTFCAQSVHSQARIEPHPLVGSDRIIEAARQAEERRAGRFGIVTSGKALTDPGDLAVIESAVETISGEIPIDPCASLGVVGAETLGRLREAGLTRYHHNLETAESFFPQVCTTRRYAESADTVLAAKAAGLSTCSGGIFGLGESPAQRVELLEAIRSLEADSVPLNFLHPIPGTRVEGLQELTPLDCLKVVAVARLMMPAKEIRVCGGREYNLRDLQSWIFLAGADGIMVGGYLTTSGRSVREDLRMIADAGLMMGGNGPGPSGGPA